MIQNSIPGSRIVWLGIIRCVAVIMVIDVHYIDPFYISPTMRTIPKYTYWATIYGSLLHPLAPLFVIIIGLLLLPIRKQPLDRFCKKHIYRVLFPFLIWSMLYSMFPQFTGILGLPKKVIGDFFYCTQGQESRSLIDSLRDVAMIPFNFSHKESHMWYICLLISLYLHMPFFSAWIENADRRTKRAFLLTWIISLFIPYLKEYVANRLFGGSGYVFSTGTQSEFGLFYYFAGFNDYLLLRRYIKKGDDQNLMETFILCILMSTVRYYTAYTGSSTTASNPNAAETEMELFFAFCSPNVLLMTLATFLLLQKVIITNSIVIRVLANMTQCGFGIYTVHYFVVGPLFLLIGPSSLPIPLQAPLMAICILLCSWAFTALIYKLMPREAVWSMGQRASIYGWMEKYSDSLHLPVNP